MISNPDDEAEELRQKVSECEKELKTMYATIKKIKKSFEKVKKSPASLSSLKDYDPNAEITKDQMELEGDLMWKTMGEEIVADIKLKLAKQLDKSQTALLKRFYEENFSLASLHKDLSKVSVINS